MSYVSTDQAKIAYQRLNNYETNSKIGNNVRAYVKGDTQHYHYDIEHLLKRFKQIQTLYSEVEKAAEMKPASDKEQMEERKTQFREKIMQGTFSPESNKELK